MQFLLPLPWLRGRDGRLQMVIDWRDPAVKRVFKMMLPVTLGLGLININALVDGVIGGWLISKNAPSTIDAAFRIYMLPQGVFSVAVATVLFPSLARLAARRDLNGFRRTSSLGLRQISFLLVPASIVTAVLAEPMTRLIYQRGAFTASQTTAVAACLAALCLGLTFNGTMLMLNRSFFSLQDNWVPTAVALGNLFLNAILDVAFAPLRHLGDPAGDVVRQHRGHRRAARRHAPPARPDRLRRDRLVVRPRPRRRSGRRRRRLRGVEAARLGCSADSLGGQLLALLPAITASVVAYLGIGSRPAGARDASATLLAQPLPQRLSDAWTSSTSATSRSSRTSTTASRRSRIAFSS